MIKVSIILPIYNVEKYLDKCLESVSSQTLKEIKILCRIDNSPDKSIEEFRKWQAKAYLTVNVCILYKTYTADQTET